MRKLRVIFSATNVRNLTKTPKGKATSEETSDVIFSRVRAKYWVVTIRVVRIHRLSGYLDNGNRRDIYIYI